MRVGHFAPDLWAPGGIASFIRRVSDAQSERGIDVRYFSYPSSFSDARGYEEVADLDGLYRATADLDILHVHQEVDSLDGARVPILRSMHENQASCPTGSRFLRERGRPCDRLAGPLQCSWGLAVDRCGSVKPASLKRYLARYRADKAVLPLIRTHTVSEFLRANMIRAGYPGDRIQTILHPAPGHSGTHITEIEGPPDGPARFLFVGRVVPSKGVQWLLRAVQAARSNFEVDIAGDGHGLAAMKKLAGSLGITNRVRFHGWVDTAEVMRLIRQSRAVVFPSVWHEPAGLVTLEAAANARPVIASAVGGIPEYAAPEFARLLRPNDVGALAATMDEFADDRELAVRMGRRGFEIVQGHYPMDAFLRRLHDLYDKTIREYRETLS